MLLDIASDNTAKKVHQAEGFKAIEWCHDSGLPQVYELTRRAFLFEGVGPSQAGER